MRAARRQGQSTLELLIALAIIVVSVAAGVALFFGGQSLLIDTQLGDEASYLARELLEEARATAREDFSAVASSSSIQGQFTKEVFVEEVDEYTKKVTAEVSWNVDPDREGNVLYVTYLTDWRNFSPPDPGDPGGGGVSGDWRNPRTLGSVDLGPGNEATDLDVIDRIVYVTATAAAAAKPDFFTVNATDGENPFIAGSVDTGSGLNAIDASGDYAYVANQSSGAELQVLDIQTITNPFVVASYDIPGVNDSSSEGRAIFYAEQKVYLGVNKVNGPEFHVVDVSNPSSPELLGSFEVDDNVNDIHVRGGYAYLATELGEAGLMVLDVSAPGAVALAGQAFSSDSKSVFSVTPSLLLLGPAQELYTVDVADAASPSQLGSVDAGNVVNDIVARDNLAFLATSNSNREFQVIDITNASSPELWSFFNFSQVGTGIDYEDNIVYVSVRSNDALRIITSSP